MSSFSRSDRHRTFSRPTHFRSSKSDLERDSGFSDASSEYLSAVDLTDTEDAGRKGSFVGQDQAGLQVAVMGAPYSGLSPMIIMNNFVLKQPSQMAPAEKQWGFPSPLDMMPQSQVVLVPMVSNGSRSSSPKPRSDHSEQSKSSMPVLKSYPRIAPHPGEPHSKRSGSSRLRGSSSSAYDQRQMRHHHDQRLYSAPSPQPAPQTPSKRVDQFAGAPDQTAQTTGRQEPPSPLPSALSPYRLEFRTEAESMETDVDQDCLSTDMNKIKRFSNTYNILDKCGLLGITLRTKQLIKENKRTQGQLLRLQEQTALLLEALGSGDPQLWTQLQLSLQETGM